MTKQKLQQELKEKVKEGIKPSDLKKLKRSKNADDVISKEKENHQDDAKRWYKKFQELEQQLDKHPYTTLISQRQDLEKLEKETTAKSDTIALLRKKIEDLEKSNPPNALLTDQLKEKQKQVESLREKLETKQQELKSLQANHSSILDQNLTLKHQGLKDWFKQYQQTKKLAQELVENVDYASNELLEQDKTISQLQGQITQLKLTNQSLQKDLNLATKLAQLRSTSLPTPENSFWKGALIGFFLVLSFYSLNSSWKSHKDH